MFPLLRLTKPSPHPLAGPRDSSMSAMLPLTIRLKHGSSPTSLIVVPIKNGPFHRVLLTPFSYFVIKQFRHCARHVNAEISRRSSTQDTCAGSDVSAPPQQKKLCFQHDICVATDGLCHTHNVRSHDHLPSRRRIKLYWVGVGSL